MRAILKKDYEKGGSILSYEVINILTDGGLYNVDELLFYDCNEDSEYPRWEERRYEIAKMCVAAIVNRCGNVSDTGIRNSVGYADALIAELKKKRK